MAFFTRSRFYFSLISLTVILGFCGSLLYWQLRDLENLKGLMAEQLESLTGRDVSIAWAELDWEDGIGLRLYRVALIDRKTSRTVFSADAVSVSMDLLSLLKQQVRLDQITLEGAEFQVTRSGPGPLRVEGLGSSLAWEGVGRWPLEQGWGHLRRLDLKNSRILFVDARPGNPPLRLEARRVQLSLSKPLLKPSVLFSVSGELSGSGGPPAPFEVNGRLLPEMAGTADPVLEGKLVLAGGHLPWFKPYLDEIFAFPPRERWLRLETDFSGQPGKHLRLQGRIDLTQRVQEAEPALRSLPPAADGLIRFDLTFWPDEIRVERLEYQGGGFRLRTEGRYAGFKSGSPRVQLKVTSSPFAVEDSHRILPFMLFHPATHEAFHQRFERGRMEIRSLAFDGTLDQLNHLSRPENLKRLSAELSLQGVDFGPRLPRLKKVRGDLVINENAHQVRITRARYEAFSISSLSGILTGVMDNPQVDWEVKGRFNLSQLKQTLKRLMDTRSFERHMNLFQDLHGSGQVRIRFQGPLRQPEQLAVTGSMELADASFTQPHLKQPFEKVRGTIRFTNRPETPVPQATGARFPWEVRFEGFSGKLGPHEITELAAETLLEEGNPVRRVYGRVKLGLLEAADLVSGTLFGRFEELLRDVTFTGGELLVDFRSEGARLALDPKGPLGLVEMKKVTLKHKAGFRPLINVSGFLYFDRDKIRLQTSEAWYGDSPVEIKGQYLNINSENPELVLRASSQEFQTTDFADIPFLQNLNYEGPAKVEFIWQSNDQYKKFENHVDLTRTAYRYGDWLVKPAGAHNTLVTRGRLLPGGGVEFKDLVYELEGNQITGHARVERPEDPTFTAHLESKKFDTLKAAPYVAALASSRSGELSFQLDGRGPVRKPEAARYQGHAHLRRLEFKPEGFVKPFTIQAEVNWEGARVRIPSGRFASDKTQVQFQGTYQGGEVPRLDLKLEGPRLVLTELLPEPGGPDDTGRSLWWRSRLLQQGEGTVELDLDEFQHRFWNLRRVSSRFSFKDRVIRIDRFATGLEHSDQILGQGIISLRDPDRPGFEALLLARAIRAEGFFRVFGPLFAHSLTGKLNWFKAKLRSQGATLKQIFQNLEGDVAIDLEQGTLQTARLRDGLRRLFQFPGKIPPRALEAKPKPYLDIFGEFVVEKGVARTENFRFEDPDQRMSLVGDFDLGHFQMDTVVGVAPLRELDRFLTKIPLVGKIITAGDEESLVKNYYTVKGGFSNPEVTPIPFTALGKKVVGIFQGILQSPTDLIPGPGPSGK